jgi:hypothetical protein
MSRVEIHCLTHLGGERFSVFFGDQFATMQAMTLPGTDLK